MQGRAVIVAGGGRGIGRACSELLAAEGARVLIADPGVATHGQEIEEGGLAEEVARSISKGGGEAVGLSEGIGSLGAGERLVKTCLERFGSVDAVLIPAAILRDRMIFNMTEDEWDTVLRVNLTGVFGLIRAASVVMKSRRSGHIVTFTSSAGLEGRAGTSNYSAAKMGVVGLTKTVAKDMSKYGVFVNCIAPRTNTRLTQLVAATRPAYAEPIVPSAIGNPSDIAPLAVYLASNRCRVTGHVFWCSGSNLGVYPDFVPQRCYRGESAMDLETVSRVIEGYLLAESVDL